MNRLTKRYNENVGIYEYVDAFSGAGIFDSILKGLTSKFVKDTATKLGTKALEAGVNKVGSEIGTRAANKVITTVDEKFFKPKPVVIKENPLGNLIMKELNKEINNKSDDDDDDYNTKTTNNYNALKKQYYGYGKGNSQVAFPLGAANSRQFQDKLNKLLK